MMRVSLQMKTMMKYLRTLASTCADRSITRISTNRGMIQCKIGWKRMRAMAPCTAWIRNRSTLKNSTN
ncbi:hypothetical protein FGO68_gene2115 [Halteria grandinella]|uniref:Uncharacterized protein n=1 Tax=Halteria grandinella TaxID=5974 RepID=A0A8J8SV30_HALGN|nr:hypothetical protein FGO68_gene2115 [Halteria grandinella]